MAPYLPGRPIGSRGCRNGRSRAVKCFFSGMVGCGAHLPTCTPDPPNGPPLGPLWRRIFWPHGNVHGGATTPFGWGFRKNFIFRKKYFFLLRLGWYVAAAGLQSTFNQQPPCPISTNAPWGFCRLKRAPRRPWKVRGSTTVRALSAFQASEMGLTGDVG